ncbi:chemokine XC receptor 1-like [Clarias gariepinus]
MQKLFRLILVVVISVYCMRLRSLTSIFILNLALSDLLFTVGLVLSVSKDIWNLTFEDAWYKAIAYTFAAGFYSHIVFLLLMSIQRYMALVHPNLGWRKRCCIICTLLGAWVVSILAAAVHIVAFLASDCVITSETTSIGVIYVDNIVFVCAFLVMGFCYIRIVQTIFHSPTNQEHKITGFAFILVVTFFIFWAPNKIMGFLDILKYHQIKSFTHFSEHFYYASHNCYLLGISRCCLNPLIYGLFD